VAEVAAVARLLGDAALRSISSAYVGGDDLLVFNEFGADPAVQSFIATKVSPKGA
jgi:hypothetical protein